MYWSLSLIYLATSLERKVGAKIKIKIQKITRVKIKILLTLVKLLPVILFWIAKREL